MIVYDFRLNTMIESDIINQVDELSSQYNKNRSKIVRRLLLLGLQMEHEIGHLFENENNLQRQ